MATNNNNTHEGLVQLNEMETVFSDVCIFINIIYGIYENNDLVI